MRKKDFNAIAGVLKYADQENWTDHLELIAEEMADALENAYPKFDRQKFLTACGIKVCNMCDEGVTEYYVDNGVCTWCERPVTS